MADSDFNDSDGDIDHDLLYDLHLENHYDDGPFAAFAPFVDLDHVGYHRGDIDYYSNGNSSSGAPPSHGDGSDDDDGPPYDVSDLSHSSEEGDTDQEEAVVHDGQYHPQSPLGAEARAADSGSDSESEEEYPADEDFEEAVEALENAQRHLSYQRHQERPAQQQDDYGWILEDEFDVDEDVLAEDDNLSDHLPHHPFGIDSDLSESQSELDLRYRSSAEDSDEVSAALDLGDSPPLSPATPPFATNLFERFAGPEFELIRGDHNRLEQERGRLEEHIRQIRGVRLPLDHGLPVPRPASGHRLAQQEAQQLLAEAEMDAERARRLDRQNRRIMSRFGAEALQPTASETSSRRRTHAQAFDVPAAPPPLQSRPPPTVIDLTDEPDSPPRQAIALPNAFRFTSAATHGSRQPQPPAQRHSRRRQGGMQRTPSLARSDGSLLGPRRVGAEAGPGSGQPTVIDLTEDGPEVVAPPPPPPPPRSVSAAAGRMPPPAPLWRAAIQPPIIENVFRQMHRHVGHLVGGPHDFLDRIRVGWAGGETPELEVQFLGEMPRPYDGGPLPGIAGLHGHRYDNPLANNHPGHLNYAGNGFGREVEREKPVHIPPPAPRQGFSRTTGDDIVAICASCENELQYDPDDKDETPAKKAKTRKDREEHHFWAVKSCGHVYCRSCFENRTKKTSAVNFKTHGKKSICNVADCDSDVTTKSAWVGIFL
ncbi:hypothetical protein DL546_002340 [Coniochaeta pulveracea]|uniref:RING-type domain-containing protein n=1 Tax=Coniochaeta pulveracea TaxID=177199 RepID=A0A420Y8G9_9PEZI|nr:hypothetical protein DL546_002340 [Coniochaeta pulveracea]